MDLRLYMRVLSRFWYLLILGVLVASALAVVSYYDVSFDGGPKLKPRAKETWQSQAILFLTEPGFPAGRRKIDLVPITIGGETTLQSQFNDPDRYTSLATLYAKLAESDRVASLMERSGGPLRGQFQAVPTADTTYRRETPLPMVSLFGVGDTPAIAVETVTRGKNAFLSYLRNQQGRADIPQNRRVVVQTINEPQPALLIAPRKKTLPFVVFIAVLVATLALLFVLENLRPRARSVAQERTLTDVRRSA